VVRRPTIRDVAKLAGVSKATVARVVNGNEDIVREETRQRVMDAVEQLGYVRNAVAGGLRNDRTYTIALCIPDITNPFWPEVARGVQDTLEAHNYTVVIVNSDWQADRELKYLHMVQQNRFDGLIINPTATYNAEIAQLGIPVILLGGGGNFTEYDSVGSDNISGMKDALNHLVYLGHKRIGLITGLSDRRKYSNRRQIYTAFHAENHMILDEDLIISGQFSDTGGYEAMHKLLSIDNPPTAVFAANDLIAIGALKAAQHRDLRIPEEVAIVGMDDIYAAEMTSPPLTTVAKPKYEIGVQAANYLLERISSDKHIEPRQLRIPCQLIIRGSTASTVAGK
jgi:DNA-binding LacI/PurR family transcriptional regulator